MEKLLLSAVQKRLAKTILLREEIYKVKEIANRINFNNLALPNLNFFERLLTKELISIKVFDDTIKFLEHFSERYPLYLISNLSTHYKNPYFNLGLDKYFKRSIFSCEVGFVKPEREIYDLVIDSSGILPGSILMIGDSLYSDYQGATKAGMKALLLGRNSRRVVENRKINSLTELLHFPYSRGT